MWCKHIVFGKTDVHSFHIYTSILKTRLMFIHDSVIHEDRRLKTHLILSSFRYVDPECEGVNTYRFD